MTGAPLAVMLRPLGLGDFLSGVPAYRAVARAFPRHRKVLVAPERFAQLALLVGGVDEVVGALPLWPLPEAVQGADLAINLHGRGPQSHEILLASQPKRIVAFAHPDIPESKGGAEWRKDEHELQRWCRMLTHAGIPADPMDFRLHKTEMAVPRRFRGVTIVHPGAASASRRWPLERWTSVVNALRDRDHDLIVTGNREEVPLAEELSARTGLLHRRCIAGKTSLLGLAAIVSEARMIVCGDTGIAHLASAYGRPSVVLFGPTSPAEWGPPPAPVHRVLWSGKLGDPHADKPDAGLLEIAVEQVLSAVEDLDRYTAPAA